MSAISKIKISEKDYQIIGSPRYANCATAANTASKQANLVDDNPTLVLETGVRISVRFANANTAKSPTLNINNTGAKAIYWQGEPIASGQHWQANDTLDFVYNGAQWDLVSKALPIENGGGENSLVINEGTATGDYSIASGTTDKSLVTDIVGIDISTLPDSMLEEYLGDRTSQIKEMINNPSEATGAASISHGNGNKSITGISTTLGVANMAGSRGFYIYKVSIIDNNSVQVVLTSKRFTTFSYNSNVLSASSSSLNKATWSGNDELSKLAVGDYIDIYLKENSYHACGTITSISDITLEEGSSILKYNFTTKAITISNENGIGITATALEGNATSGLSNLILKPYEYTIRATHKPDVGTNETYFGGTAIGFGNIASGNLSHAEGYMNIASGNLSHAEGMNTSATKHSSHAEGMNTKASGIRSHAEGYNTRASGSSSHAEGFSAKASGTNSHAEGHITEATGNASHAEGHGSIASGNYSHAEGYISTASGSYSHAEGVNTTSSGIRSHAEGWLTTASEENSHAEGRETTASGLNSHAEGYNTTASGGSSHAEGGGTIASGVRSHAEGSDTRAYEENSHAEGSGTVARGVRSHAEGNGSIASGSSSHAEGSGTTASGTRSHAEGYGTTAEGENSHAEGNGSTASGQTSHAEGTGTKATNKRSHAEGYYTTAEGENSHAEGNSTTASGENSHAEGNSTTASGNGSHAEGYNTTASNFNAHAEGSGTVASGMRSHAEGCNTVATGENSHVQGKYNILDVKRDSNGNMLDKDGNITTDITKAASNNNYAHIVGNGENEETRSNAHTLDWNGNAWFAGNVTANELKGYVTVGQKENTNLGNKATAEGNNTTASGSYSHAEGSITTASGSYSHAEGYNTKASGSYSHAEGSITTASGSYSHAEGYYTKASGYCSHAEGYYTNASGSYSHAEGYYTNASGHYSHAEGFSAKASNDYAHAEGHDSQATGMSSHAEGAYTKATNKRSHAEGYYTVSSGENSHAEGNETKASGDKSHAEGNGTVASGNNSHAEGYQTTASGMMSHAEGSVTIASGSRSHAEGFYTIAAGENQHVQGKYNIKDTNNVYAHIVGNGTAEDARSNAHTLDWDGNAWFAGNVTAPTFEGNLDGEATSSVKDSSGNVITETYETKSDAATKLNNLTTQINTKQNAITGTAGQFVVIGDDGNITTKNIVVPTTNILLADLLPTSLEADGTEGWVYKDGYCYYDKQIPNILETDYPEFSEYAGDIDITTLLEIRDWIPNIFKITTHNGWIRVYSKEDNTSFGDSVTIKLKVVR